MLPVNLPCKKLIRLVHIIFLIILTHLIDPVIVISTADISSDDFNASVFKTSRRHFVSPTENCTVSTNGMQVSISVHDCTFHDIFRAGNFTPRIIKYVSDTDFEIELKFDSVLNAIYQFEAVLAKQDDRKFFRSDFYNAGIKTRVLCAGISSEQSNAIQKEISGLRNLFYMRVKRVGNDWTYSYSYNHKIWTRLSAFPSYSIVIPTKSIGIFSLSSSGNKALNAFEDYFFNIFEASSPSTNINPLDHEFDVGEPTTLSKTIAEKCLLVYKRQKKSVDIANEFLSVNNDPATLFTTPDSSSIDIWYAKYQGNGTYYQAFGQIGLPQRWINILGNAFDPDGLALLTYSLRGGPEKHLTIGPDRRRLQRPGDFNVEIALAELIPSPDTNKVVITATDFLGNHSKVTVNVEYFEGNVWPDVYSLNWRDVEKIDEATQVIDGLWMQQNNSVRTVIPGYDRLIAIGDVLWKDYEIIVPVTIKDILTNVNAPGVGILLRWDGHHQWNNDQPSYGWHPMGALGWYRYKGGVKGARLMIIGGESDLKIEDTSGKKLTFGETYIFKMRVQTINNSNSSKYSLKVWKQGQSEPLEWDLVGEEDHSSLPNGSLLLVAHNADASFGNVTVLPLSKSISPLISTQSKMKAIVTEALIQKPQP